MGVRESDQAAIGPAGHVGAVVEGITTDASDPGAGLLDAGGRPARWQDVTQCPDKACASASTMPLSSRTTANWPSIQIDWHIPRGGLGRRDQSGRWRVGLGSCAGRIEPEIFGLVDAVVVA